MQTFSLVSIYVSFRLIYLHIFFKMPHCQAFAVLVINAHCSGETASRVDEFIKSISIGPFTVISGSLYSFPGADRSTLSFLLIVRSKLLQDSPCGSVEPCKYAYELVFLAIYLIYVICTEYLIQHILVLVFNFRWLNNFPSKRYLIGK